jgi:hypothetical protein
VQPNVVLSGEGAGWLRRIDTGSEEGLIRVNVADAGEVALVHDHLLDGLPASAQDPPKPFYGEIVIQRLGSDGGGVPCPLLRVEQQQRSQPANVAVDELLTTTQLSAEDGVLCLVWLQGMTMNHERSGHAWLYHQARRIELQNRMLGPAGNASDRRTCQITYEPSPGNTSQHVVMTYGDASDPTAYEGRPDTADYRFDFGQFGHRCRHSVTVIVPFIVG